MKPLRIAAFSHGSIGGNPAGVVIAEMLPSPERMQSVAVDLGDSETAFAAPTADGWRVRYFAPEAEVPFCGHATIALGAALAMTKGNGIFKLQLNNVRITVEGKSSADGLWAALRSPPTRSAALDAAQLLETMNLFKLSPEDLDTAIAPAFVNAGSGHFVLSLKQRSRLAVMDYDLAKGRTLMRSAGLATIALVHARDRQNFDARNAFAGGGVFEDPATGAAAAFGGYLRISTGHTVVPSTSYRARIWACPRSFMLKYQARRAARSECPGVLESLGERSQSRVLQVTAGHGDGYSPTLRRASLTEHTPRLGSPPRREAGQLV
jgi:PhzF family phenazine biosynthesis protein